MRKSFVMTDQQFETLIAACKPVPYMVFGGRPPRSQQENANDAWNALGCELGFDYMTVRPGKTDREFTAETTEPSP